MPLSAVRLPRLLGVSVYVIVSSCGLRLSAQPKPQASPRVRNASPPDARGSKVALAAGDTPPTPAISSPPKVQVTPDAPMISTAPREIRGDFESLIVGGKAEQERAVKTNVPGAPLSATIVAGSPVPGEGPARPSMTRSQSASFQVPLGGRDRFVDVVAIGDARHFFCSGIVVEREWVLTARHCQPASRVLLGNDIAGTASIIAVDRVVEPPGPTLDAVLLHLVVPVRLVPRARRANARGAGPIGYVRLVGFGATDVFGRRGFGVKREVDVPVGGWACEGARASHYACVAGAELVLPRPGLGDACRGDSGGPVLELDQGRFRLVAITSRAIPGRSRICGDGGIYTRVDVLATWMSSVFGGTRE